MSMVDDYKEFTVTCMSPEECSSHTNKSDCIDAGCYWYDGACHAEKPPEEENLWDKIIGWWNRRTTVEKAFVVGAPSLLFALMIARPAPGRRGAAPVVYPPYYPTRA